MWWVYDHYKYIYYFNAEFDIKRQKYGAYRRKIMSSMGRSARCKGYVVSIF